MHIYIFSFIAFISTHGSLKIQQEDGSLKIQQEDGSLKIQQEPVKAQLGLEFDGGAADTKRRTAMKRESA